MASQKQSVAFEIGIHHCLLKADWEALKAVPSFLDTLEKDSVQTQINALNEYIEKPYNFQSDVKLKRLQKKIKALDDYIATERRKCRIIKDLSHLPDMTVTIE